MARPYAKLRGLLREHEETYDDMSRFLLISRQSIADRMNRRAEWRIGEMYAIMNHYGIPHKKLNQIFPMYGKNE